MGGASDAPAPDDILRATGLATLGDDPPAEAVEDALRKLGELAGDMDALRRETLRAAACRIVRPHAFRAAAVDAALGRSDDGDDDGRQGSRITFADPEPWPAPVEGVALLGDIEGTYRRYVGLPAGAAEALALWTVHAHAHDVAEISPVLALTSPEKRCGKTTTLHVLGALVPRPLPTANVTAAALFRAVEAFRPTLLIDEADTFLRDREELRGTLNSGHARASAKSVRTVGDEHEVRSFSTWAPKAVAMIGALPDTLADRSILLAMRRRHPDEVVDRLRLDRLGELEPLRRQAWRWGRDHMGGLRHADPDVPGELHDRAADCWRPLLAIADAVGGEWPERARHAARVLAGAADDDDGSVRTLLLRDLRTLYDERGAERLTSAEIVEALAAMEERPWPEWRRGEPITTRGLARLLQPYDVRPRQYREGAQKLRGYAAEDLGDAWGRYLPAQSTPADPVQPVQSNDGAGFPGSANRYTPPDVPTCEIAENPTATTDVPDVPTREGGTAADTPSRPAGPLPLWPYGAGAPVLDAEDLEYLDDEREGVRDG